MLAKRDYTHDLLPIGGIFLRTLHGPARAGFVELDSIRALRQRNLKQPCYGRGAVANNITANLTTGKAL